MRCDQIMTKNPATLPRNASVQEAAKLMADRDIGFVPIVDDSGLVAGVLTDRDLAIRVLAKGMKADGLKVGDVMSKDIVTCEAGKDTDHCQKLMSEHKISRILIVDTARKPVGVISLQDLTQTEEESEVGETIKEVKQEGASIH